MAISYMVDVDNEWLVLSDVHTIKHILELNDDSKTLTQLANSKMKKKQQKNDNFNDRSEIGTLLRRLRFTFELIRWLRSGWIMTGI